MDNFKYLGVKINSKNDISERIASGNRCHYGLSILPKSKILSSKLKALFYTSYLTQIITYACEAWSSLKGITADWQYSNEKYLKTFLAQYTIRS